MFTKRITIPPVTDQKTPKHNRAHKIDGGSPLEPIAHAHILWVTQLLTNFSRLTVKKKSGQLRVSIDACSAERERERRSRFLVSVLGLYYLMCESCKAGRASWPLSTGSCVCVRVFALLHWMESLSVFVHV